MSPKYKMPSINCSPLILNLAQSLNHWTTPLIGIISPPIEEQSLKNYWTKPLPNWRTVKYSSKNLNFPIIYNKALKKPRLNLRNLYKSRRTQQRKITDFFRNRSINYQLSDRTTLISREIHVSRLSQFSILISVSGCHNEKRACCKLQLGWSGPPNGYDPTHVIGPSPV